MTVRVIRSLPELVELSDPWASLADVSGARHYAQPFWCLSWWRHLSRGDLNVIAVESGGRLVALAPLYRTQMFGVDVLRFLGSGLRPVMEILVSPDDKDAAPELWSYLAGRDRWLMDLQDYRLAGAALSQLRRADGAVPVWSATLTEVCPTVRVGLSWESYFQSRDSALRRKLRRAEQAAEREGVALRAEIGTTPDDVTRLLPDVDAVYEAAERTRPRLHFLAGPFRPFTVEILFQAARESRLALIVFYVGDQPVATAFGFRGGTTYGYSGPRFHPDFSRFSPGHAVLAALIEHAHRLAATEVDLLVGDTPYKREWSTGSYDGLTLIAASSQRLRILNSLENTAMQSRQLRSLARKGQAVLPRRFRQTTAND